MRPGGDGPAGNKGSVSIEDLTEDNDDTELMGAKRVNRWDAWEE